MTVDTLKEKKIILLPEITLSPNSHFAVETVVFTCDFEMQRFFKSYHVIEEQTIFVKNRAQHLTLSFLKLL